MKKYLRLFLVLIMTVSLLGCNRSEKTQDTDTFFTAFNHLLEAGTLQLDGNYAFNEAAGTFQFYLDQKGQLALMLDITPEAGRPIQFFIRDGRTYLNYMGTKTQSVVQNIGLSADSKLSVYNPFLNLNRGERAELFDSITRNGDTYEFAINKNKLQALLDAYGSISLDKADMTAKLPEGELKELSLTISGAVNMGSEPLPVALDLQIRTESLNQPVDIPWPEDLDQYAR